MTSLRSLALLSFASLLVFGLPEVRAVNHNPVGQEGTPQTTDVTITAATATRSGNTVTVSVTVDGGTNAGLLAIGEPPQLKAYAADDTEDALNSEEVPVTAAGDFTITITQECDCTLDIYLEGLTDTSGNPVSASKTGVTVTEQGADGEGETGMDSSGSSGGGGDEKGDGRIGGDDGRGGGIGGDGDKSGAGDGGAGRIKIDSPVGPSVSPDSGFGTGAGTLSISGGKPSEDLFTPAIVRHIGGADSVEKVPDPASPGVLRQMVAANQITDIVSLPDGGFKMSVYDLSARGPKGPDGVYAIDGTPTRVTEIRNPGKTVVANTNDPALFEKGRYQKNLKYKLPVPDGRYKAQIYVSEPFYEQADGGAFSISAQGQMIASRYDPFQEAGGLNKAVIKEVDVTVTNGELTLDFAALNKVARISAIKIVGAGGAVPGADAALYSTNRNGAFSYQTALADGDYQVSLYFAEPVYSAAGKRVFDVLAQGQVVLNDYDIRTQAGGTNVGRKETFTVTVTGGQLTLDFVKITGEPLVSGLVVKSVASGATMMAVHCGGPACTGSDGTEFAVDSGFVGGVADYPGAPRLALKAGPAHTASDGTVFASDESYVSAGKINGYVVDTSLTGMRVTRKEVGKVDKVYDYGWKTDPVTAKFGELSLGTPGSLKKESRKVVWAADDQSYDETWTLTDGAGNIVARTVYTFERFPFGLRKVAEKKIVSVATGEALTTTWTYHEGSANPADPRPDGYGLIASMKAPDGYWEKYVYNGSGSLIKTISQYQNSAFGDEPNSKVQTLAVSSGNPRRTSITTIKGQETARSYEVRNVGIAPDEYETLYITCVTPGAAWDADNNLVTTTRTYTYGHPDPVKRGKTRWTLGADEVLTTYDYSVTGSSKTVARATGAPLMDAITDKPYTNNALVVSGTRVVTTTNAAGKVIGEDTIDVQSGLPLSGWEALDVDSRGRPTLIDYGDGTTKSFVYVGSAAACGSCSGSGAALVDSETDRNGVTTSYDYDALNRRTDTTRLGVREHVVYDAADRILERHRIGTDNSDIRIEKNVYDLAGRIVESYDALNNRTDYAYAYPVGGGRIVTTTYPAATVGAPRGTRIVTTYGDGRTKEISGTAVSPMKYAYGTWSASGQAGEWTQEIKVGDAAVETEWTKTYADLLGRQTKMEYADSAQATMHYNLLGQLDRQTDPDGVQTLYAYNARGERETTAINLHDTVIGTPEIDEGGIDRITKTVHDVYSRSGTIVRRTTTRVWATDNANTPTTVSVIEQDGYGNRSWQKDAATAESSTVLARTGAGAWTVTATAPDGSQQVQTYTSGRLITSSTYTSTSTLNLETTYDYDPHGRLQSQTDARTGAVAYTYTDRDEVLTVKANNNTETTTYAYDALGNQLTITRPDTSVTTNEYHLRNNQLKKTSGSLAYPVEYTYDLQGRMKTLTTWQNATTSAEAAVTTWNYDTQRGWLTQKLYADNTGPAYTYKPSGRLLTRTWARTVASALLVTTYGYNNAGDLASTAYSNTTTDVAITYTRFGAQKTVTDATGTRTFTYVPATLRPHQEQLPSFYGSRILARTYQVTASVSEPTSVPGRNNGFTLGITGNLARDYSVVYGYDTSGRLSTVTDPSGTFTSGYLANSNLRESLTGPVHVATTTYEPYRNVIDTVENKVGGTTVSKFDYTVNNLGQRTQRANTGTAFGTASTDVFTYNAKGEVESATNATIPANDQGYTYDDIGNRATSSAGFQPAISYKANALNQYEEIVAGGQLVEPSYDLDGNQEITGAGQVYTWDAENRLVAIEPVIPAAGDKKQLNVYDAQSRRVRKQVSTYVGGTWSLTTDEKFVYDGWNLVAVLDATDSNTLVRTYTWGLDLSGSLQGAGGVGGLLATSEISSGTISNTYHYTYDANGNVSEVLNGSGGIAAHYEYDAFGSTVASSGTYAATNAYRFSTKPLDSVSGLYYYSLRYYNPSAGRWINRDPIGERGGVGLFSFIYNDPIAYVDYLGLSFYTPGKDNMTGYPDTEVLDRIRNAVTALNALRDGGNRPCYKAKIKYDSATVDDVRNSITNDSNTTNTIVAAHGNGKGGRVMGGGSYSDDAANKVAGRHGETCAGSGNSISSYGCYSGDSYPGSDTTWAAVYLQIAENLESQLSAKQAAIDAGGNCCSPIVINLLFGKK